MTEILILIHFGIFGVVVIVVKVYVKMKDSKDLHKHKDNDPRVKSGT